MLPPVVGMRGIECFEQNQAPFRFTAIQLSQSSLLSLSALPGTASPALLITISTLPYRSDTASLMRFTSSSCLMSVCTKRALFPPCRWIALSTHAPRFRSTKLAMEATERPQMDRRRFLKATAQASICVGLSRSLVARAMPPYSAREKSPDDHHPGGRGGSCSVGAPESRFKFAESQSPILGSEISKRSYRQDWQPCVTVTRKIAAPGCDNSL